MKTREARVRIAAAQRVSVTDTYLAVELADGRVLSVPLAWYPRLQSGTAHERAHWQLIGRGEGLHWPDLDEDISVEGLVAGRASGESQKSLERWLAQRNKRPHGSRGRAKHAPKPV